MLGWFGVSFRFVGNYVVSQSDTTRQKNFSRTLENIVHVFSLDTWDTSIKKIFTRYALTGASRIARIYISNNLKSKTKGIETVVAAFTDHLAIVLRLSIDAHFSSRGRGYWTINTSLLGQTSF